MPVCLFRAVRESRLSPPDTAGGIQAQAQPIVLRESAIWSKLAGQPSAIRDASCYAANWLKTSAHCTILLRYCQSFDTGKRAHALRSYSGPAMGARSGKPRGSAHRVNVVGDFGSLEVRLPDPETMQAVEPKITGMGCLKAGRHADRRAARWGPSLQKLLVAVIAHV